METLLGQTLQGRYLIKGFLGRGGMADVYLAHDAERSVDVALKVMREDLAEEPDFVRRFAREAQALAKLDHPNIVRFYSFEQHGHIAFIVMDYVSGGSLRRRLLDANGPLSLDEAGSILHQVGAALSYAHKRGFVHRDVKPGNVMFDGGGRALLSDFGIARVAEATTATSSTVGTPAYMSPEQVMGREPSPQSDVYSLGVVLYEMIAGRRPFVGDAGTGTSTSERVRDEHLHYPAPDPATFNPLVPASVSAVVLRALAKSTADRWPDVTSLVRAWDQSFAAPRRAALDQPTAVMHLPAPDGRAPVAVRPVALEGRAPTSDRPGLPTRTKRSPLLLLLAVPPVVLLAVGAMLVMSRPVATPPPAAGDTQVVVAPATTLPTIAALAAAPTRAVEPPTPLPTRALRHIRVATQADFPPFEYRDAAGRVVGFDIELMGAIGRQAGFVPDFVDVPFDGIFARLAQGEYDAVISAATITEQRKATVSFSAPYFDTGQAAAVRKDSPLTRPGDLNGHVVGVQQGTWGEQVAVDNYGDANVRRFDGVPPTFEALLRGTVDGVVVDLPVCYQFLAKNPRANVRMLPDLLTREQYGIAVPKGNLDLLAAINSALAEVRANGTYDALYRKWITGAGG